MIPNIDIEHDNVDGDTAPAPASELFQAAMDALMPLKLEAFPDRVTKDEDGLLVAMAVALRADCTRRRVGAVIVDVHGRIVGTGRNGAPAGRPGCLSAGACPRGQLDTSQVAPGAPYGAGAGLCIALHAEANACLYSDPAARRGATVFVTDAPCDACSLLLAGSGVSRVVWPERDEEGSWRPAERLIGPEHPIGGHYA